MVGLHFFSPVPVMRLVEIVVALDTDRETVDAARAFAIALGKTPIETKDRSGFIVNMLLVPYLMAAVRMFEEGFATREDIDAGMKLGCGHPMGPLTLERLHRARRAATRSASRSTTSSSATSTRRRRCSSGWSPQAGSDASPGAASTSTASRGEPLRGLWPAQRGRQNLSGRA